MGSEENAKYIANQVGNGNAGRDIHNQENGPGTFQMPATLKDETVLKAEKLLMQLENLANLRSLLYKEIEGYQAGHYTAAQLQETIDFVTLKMTIV